MPSGASGSHCRGTADYDKDRYTQIRRAIEADPKHLLGKSFYEVSKEFNLEDVPWDDITVQDPPNGQSRIYHFRGFLFVVALESQAGSMPPLPLSSDPREDIHRIAMDNELFGSKACIARQPYVEIDGISDPKEQIKQFWKREAEKCERNTH